MTFTFQPQFIKQDSAVPLRMMVGGWAVGVAAIIWVGPVANRFAALVGITLTAGALILLTLTGSRVWRMILGAGAGAFATWLGYHFACPDRLILARDDPLEYLDREHLAAVAVGLSMLSIGLGGLLESLRAQAAPGSSPIPVRVLLVGIGVGIALAGCSAFGVSTGISIIVAVAAAVGLVVLTWVRRERPNSDFVPQP